MGIGMGMRMRRDWRKCSFCSWADLGGNRREAAVCAAKTPSKILCPQVLCYPRSSFCASHLPRTSKAEGGGSRRGLQSCAGGCAVLGEMLEPTRALIRCPVPGRPADGQDLCQGTASSAASR